MLLQGNVSIVLGLFHLDEKMVVEFPTLFDDERDVVGEEDEGSDVVVDPKRVWQYGCASWAE